MAGTPSVAILRDIQTLFDIGTAGGLTDRQLLERFANPRDLSADAAFEALILRHGPMILRVCRNLLREESDVSDAFQATFLVLIRRRETIRGLESVGGWLYGVACRVAARARVDAARRRVVEQRVALRVVEAVDGEEQFSPARDFGPVLQEEVRRLPERYRAVVVLCYWQSLTHEQAAAQLGCPLGTVRSRLARARKLLQRRLIRRGLAPLAAFVVSVLNESAFASTLPAVPLALVKATARAAAASASGQALSYIVSGATASLVKRVLWSMAMIKIKTVAVGLALVGFLGFGTAFVTVSGQQGKSQAEAKSDKAVPRSGPLKDPEGTALVYQSTRDSNTVVAVARHASIVKKGDVVCELDSAGLRDELTNQKAAVVVAENTYRNQGTAREVAEMSYKEYAEGLFHVELTEIESTRYKAESELASAERLANQAHGKKEGLPEQLSLQGARIALEAAQLRKKVLLELTKPRRLKELSLAIAKAVNDELGSKAAWELEITKQNRLERQISACTIRAPRDGTLIHAFPELEEGALVQHRQLLFKILPR